MPNSPRAGQPAQPEDLVDVDALLAAYHDRHPDPSDPAAAGRVRHLRAPRLVADHHVQRRPHRRHQPGHRRVPGRRRAPTGPLFIGRDTHALSEPAWVTACEVFLANDVHVLVDAADGFTPTPAVSHAILGAQPRPRPTGLADGVVITPSHNPPPRRRLQVQPAATAARPTPTPRSGSRTAPTSCWTPSSTACSAARSIRGALGPLRLPRRLRRRPAQRRRHGRDPGGGRADRRRPARRGQRGLLGRDRRAPRDRPHRGQPGRRPAVRVHDARLGRQDPDGLLVAVRDGLARGRAATATRSPPATTPTPTGTASSPPTPG